MSDEASNSSAGRFQVSAVNESVTSNGVVDFQIDDQQTREVLPRLDNYRHLYTLTSSRPTLDELHDGTDKVRSKPGYKFRDLPRKYF